MIGGTDIIIRTRNETEALDWAVRSISRMWPNVVLGDADSGQVLSPYGTISFFGRREILAFRDRTAARLWDELGADPSLIGTLVHFLASPSELTVAIDDNPPRQIKLFVEALRQSLNSDLFACTASFEEAA